MATKKLLGLNEGIPGTIGTADTGSVPGALSVTGVSTLTGAVTAAANIGAASLSTTGDATIGGDLNVAGVISSSGSEDVVSEDPWHVQGIGYITNNVVQSVGWVGNAKAVDTFTAATITAVEAAEIGSTAFSATLTVGSLPTATQNIKMTNKNQEYKVNFIATGTTDAVFNSSGTANIALDVDDDTSKVGDALRTLFDAIPQYNTSGGTTACTILATNFSAQLAMVFTQDAAASITVASVSVANGDAAYFTKTGGTAFASNDVIGVSDANDAKNIGVFVVSSIDGDKVFIKGVNSVTTSSNMPWCQTNLETDATGGGKIIKAEFYIQGMSDGVNFPDAGGTALPEGRPMYAFGSTGIETNFTDNGSYKLIGADSGDTTLQKAYDAGASITTDASGDITFNIDNSEDFIVKGQSSGVGQVVFGETNDIDAFLANTQDEIAFVGGKDATAANLGVSITSNRTNTVSNVGDATQTAALHIESVGGISIESAKETAISQISDLSAAATMTIGAYTPTGADAASENNLVLKGDKIMSVARFIAFAPIRANGAVSLVRSNGTAASGTLTVTNTPVNASSLTINSTDIAALQTINFATGSTASPTTFTSNAATIGVDGKSNDALAGEISTLLNSLGGVDPVLRCTVATNVVTINSSKYLGASGDITWGSSGTTNITAAAVASNGVAGIYAQEAGNNDPGKTYNVIGANISTTLVATAATVEVAVSGIVDISCSIAIANATVGQPVYIAADVPVSNTSSAGQVTGTAPSDVGSSIFKVGIALEPQASAGAKFAVLLQPQFISKNDG